ncbi:MAG: Jag N-terminal domain-containing protein, partial [Actinomycetota bacterium]|nr:Jag N-terminal domain-containing protein [Actinomycetota bacterium]
GSARMSRGARLAPRTTAAPSTEYEQSLLSLLCGSDSARETLSAIDKLVTDETLAALSRCSNNRPRDEQDLLALLYVSNAARQALHITAEPLTDEALDVIAGCLQKVEQQVDRGILHEGAGMDWAPVQALNERFWPPAHTLPGLLQRSQGLPAETVDTVGKLGAAMDIPSLDDDLDLLLSHLNHREAEVFMKRFSVERRYTLEEVGSHLGVTRERVRQISKSVSKRLRNAYYWELPLLRIRTAILLIHQRQLFAINDILNLLRESGLTSSEATVRTLLAVWRAIDPDKSGVRETLALWRAVNPAEYVFPEGGLSVPNTGLTPVQQALSKNVTPAARTLAGRTGAVTTVAVREALGYKTPASDEEVATILAKVGFREVAPGYWAGRAGDYSAPREIMGKMLSACGPLSLQQLRRGVLRHHKRFGYPVVPVHVLGAILGHDEAFEVRGDALVVLKKPELFRTHKGNAEGTWLQLVGEEGPVVHAHRILRAFQANGLQNVTAYRLMKESALVEKAGRQLFCLPGARITEADLSAGRRQEIWSGRSEWARSVDLGQGDTEPKTVEAAPKLPRYDDVTKSRMGDERKEFSARTVAEAIDAACSELGVGPEDLVYEIRDPGLGYMLGLSDQQATITVFLSITSPRLPNKGTT